MCVLLFNTCVSVIYRLHVAYDDPSGYQDGEHSAAAFTHAAKCRRSQAVGLRPASGSWVKGVMLCVFTVSEFFGGGSTDAAGSVEVELPGFKCGSTRGFIVYFRSMIESNDCWQVLLRFG